MNDYVLVSLVHPDDEATQASDDYALWLAQRYPPSREFHSDAPDHSLVKAAVQALTERAGLILGHGGDALRSRRSPSPMEFAQDAGRPWATGVETGDVFSGARLYLYACSTFETQFARTCVQNGVEEVAGHESKIQAPEPQDLHIRRAIGRLIRRFLDGCGEPGALQLEARAELTRDFELKLGVEGEGDQVLELSADITLQRVLQTLRVARLEGGKVAVRFPPVSVADDFES